MTACARITADGTPCLAPALRDSQYCRAHDGRPEVVRSRRDASRRGGVASHQGPPPSGLRIDVGSTEGVLRGLGEVAQALADGRIDRARAGGLVYALTAAVQAHRVLRHEDRIRELERRVGIHDEG